MRLQRPSSTPGTHSFFDYRDFGAIIPRCGSTAVNETGLDEAKEVRSASLVAYLCRFRPEPEGGFTVTCPKLPPVVTYSSETLEEAQANAREAIELCLEAMREDGQPIPPPDRDLASPIDQLVAVADADA
jgi:antitoxin HicB